MERSILKRGVHMWLMVALAASPTVAAQVPVELDKGSIYAHVVDAGAELHRCPSTQTRCRFVVPPGPALLQVVFRGGDKRERTLRLVDGVGVRVGISAKNTAALYATISGVATAVLGYAVLLPLGLEDFDTGLLVAGLQEEMLQVQLLPQVVQVVEEMQ